MPGQVHPGRGAFLALRSGGDAAHSPSSHQRPPRWQDTPPANPQPKGDRPHPRAPTSAPLGRQERPGRPAPAAAPADAHARRPALSLGGHGPCLPWHLHLLADVSLEPITFNALSSPLRSSPALPMPRPRPLARRGGPRCPARSLPGRSLCPSRTSSGLVKGTASAGPRRARGPSAARRRPSARGTHPEVTGRRLGGRSEPRRRRARRLPSPPAL